MTNYREILRLHNLGLNNSQTAASSGASRTTVIDVLHRVNLAGIGWDLAAELSDRELFQALFPNGLIKPDYKMPDFEHVHREMAKSGVTLSLLWFEYCDKCRESGDVPYQLTQFKKYYRDFVISSKATMHIHRKRSCLVSPPNLMHRSCCSSAVALSCA